MTKPIEYIFDSVWVAGHCVQSMAATDAGSILTSDEIKVGQSCCAPNVYLAQNAALLRDEGGKCLLLELFQDEPSAAAMKLLEQSVAADPSLAESFVHHSLMKNDNQLNTGYIESVESILSPNRPALTSVIVKQIADCGMRCIDAIVSCRCAIRGIER